MWLCIEIRWILVPRKTHFAPLFSYTLQTPISPPINGCISVHSLWPVFRSSYWTRTWTFPLHGVLVISVFIWNAKLDVLSVKKVGSAGFLQMIFAEEGAIIFLPHVLLRTAPFPFSIFCYIFPDFFCDMSLPQSLRSGPDRGPAKFIAY